ncbi:MAG: TIGR03546 family protein [Spirochaetaceae bacterium]|nr:MAG: TIGR03546 family protein [Spirochaetaceae bacterium]
MIIRLVAKLIALLNSNGRASEIGAGIAFGLWLALVPGGNLLFFALALTAFLVKINLGLTIVSFAVFLPIVPIADRLLDRIGYWILTRAPLEPVFARLLSTTIVPWTRFNDTIVMGGLVVGVVLFVPVAALATLFVRLYRRYIHARIAQSKIVKAIKATPIAQKLSAAIAQVRRVWPAAA